MKNFHCTCGNTLYFESCQCVACGNQLGYLPESRVLSVLEMDEAGQWHALAADAAVYRMCGNYSGAGVCNWMVPADDPNAFCLSCRLNQTIPDLSLPRNHVLWQRIENSKRRLIYTLMALGLPVVGMDKDPQLGLAFAFLADEKEAGEFRDEADQQRRILTGHSGGLITINLAEADPGERERMREEMNELYRTLLGHFRHESGHYYWGRLIRHSPRLNAFRELFGDERVDYDEALERYYAGAIEGAWQDGYVSAYASAHPWEDWAETWAHYLNMVDTFETAEDEGLTIEGKEMHAMASGSLQDFEALCQEWARLTLAMNALSRSMGAADPYPFVLSANAVAKLRFVHETVATANLP